MMMGVHGRDGDHEMVMEVGDDGLCVVDENSPRL